MQLHYSWKKNLEVILILGLNRKFRSDRITKSNSDFDLNMIFGII